ncbi:DUF1294 domain-containing protein [Halomonas sp. LBP4]|uniref:DUF1294 domain-containing protein n=1 Tax=Halomonas sp. LBP4 TaxID=2044917 RepID=UPI000D76ABC4|nr:DUF1294 domain-containing protein [Halomonas sp. LBP4]PXX95902.1 cold-shock protein [Halomonas sp. LBP4]
MHYIATWYAGFSLIAIMMFWWDKASAQRGAYRTAETKLFTVSFLGGWPGSYLARHLFRHKTRKPGFGRKLAFTSIANLVLVAGIGLILPRGM